MASPDDRSMLDIELAFIAQEARAVAAASRLKQARLEQTWLATRYAAIGRMPKPAAEEALRKLLG